MKEGISTWALAKMGCGEDVSTEVLRKICEVLDCTFPDIVELYWMNQWNQMRNQNSLPLYKGRYREGWYNATIIAAPSSTKNREGRRDPEMHQTKKGNQWYHGMKVHFGVDAGSGYVHTITGTAANVYDIEETAKLLWDDDEEAYGDSGYSGIEKRDEIKMMILYHRSNLGSTSGHPVSESRIHTMGKTGTKRWKTVNLQRAIKQDIRF